MLGEGEGKYVGGYAVVKTERWDYVGGYEGEQGSRGVR